MTKNAREMRKTDSTKYIESLRTNLPINKVKSESFILLKIS